MRQRFSGERMEDVEGHRPSRFERDRVCDANRDDHEMLPLDAGQDLSGAVLHWFVASAPRVSPANGTSG